MPTLSDQDRIDLVLKETMRQNHLAGVSVAVKHNGEVILAKGYGYADLEEKIKATEHTVFRTGSITKQFTAVAVMMLVEQGAIHLDDNMRDYLPDYPDNGNKVTIDQLLNHTSGIKSMTDIKKFWDVSHRDLSREEMVELFSFEPAEFSPGEKFQYNNSGYYLLGLIIEKISGMSYSEFLREHIWKPLEMFDTHYLGSAKHIDNLATGYDYKESEFVEPKPLGMENPFAGGSLGSSARDLLKWQGALNNHQLITKKSYEKMVRPSILNNGEMTTYGYGFFLSSLNGHCKIEHGGDINGFRAQLSYYPKDDLTVVVLCNLDSAPRAQLESQISRMMLGIPEIVIEEVHLSEDELQIYTGNYTWSSTMAPIPFPVSVVEGRLSLGIRQVRALGNHRFVFVDDPYHAVWFILENGKPVCVKADREGQKIEGILVK